MSSLSEQIKKNNASAFTHSGKFHADDVFSAALLLYLNPEINFPEEIRFRKTSTALFLTLGGGSMTITRRTAASGKTECLMRHLDFSGRLLERKFLGQELAEKCRPVLCAAP